MAPLFSKRLSCFYCGRRSAQSDRGPVRKWCCNHCEAINYLDEKGEITDPPAAETNPAVYGPDASSNPPFESSDFTASGLFCAQCIRNQHLFTSALASYFPSTDDPTYSAYEREYPQFRQNMQERYPQVCVKCEPLVKDRIRQAGYEAKSDHLRRMMDRSKAGRAARHARNRNWRSLLVFAGAIGYWSSVAGQLSWDVLGALDAGEVSWDPDHSPSPSLASCAQRALQERQLPSHCLVDLAPYAGLSLVAGILSLWWNPKLRSKIEGRGGRFAGLGEYYQIQLIVMVVRCAFWAVLKDPSSSGLQPTLPPALHLFMIFFTVLSVAISRRVVQYDTRPLVTWNETTPAATPNRKNEASSVQSAGNKQPLAFSSEVLGQTSQRFPLEKLGTPRPSPEKQPAIPTPPPEVDDMDWTPSVQHEIRPTVSVHERDQRSVLDGPLPFYGSLPAAPRPPAWNLRGQPQKPKPIEQVVERNPFHRAPVQPPDSWKRNASHTDTVFAPPKFFPVSDHVESTGLESLFDKTFTIKTPEDEGKESWQRQAPQESPRQPGNVQNVLVFQYLRLGLLLVSLLAWALLQSGLFSVPGNYIEVASLGSASLIAGFALLEVLKRPIVYWDGMEILVYFAELAAAVHLGGNLPRVSFEREYFDRYGKLLLIFMAAQETLGLLSLYRDMSAHAAGTHKQPENHQMGSSSNRDAFNYSPRMHEKSPVGLPGSQSLNSLSSVAPLSFSTTAADSSFSTQPAEPHYQPSYSTFNQGFTNNDNKNHSFTLNSLKENESDASDPFEHDSDTETSMTTATTATNATNATIRNIRYGGDSNDNFFSPRRTELGPGIGGLSLDDRPTRRMTRSQTKQELGGGAFSRRYTRGMR